ncbi:MAG: hypothetical protein QOG53_1225 [Frankiales bacterium]|jgi:uncharacterized protein YndB with AHSA1/START domain|nr:hypothetical protein [Frankiales bacterium]
MDLGTYVEHDGRPAVRFVRTYPHPIERVWAAVTDPDELSHWFPSRAEIELHIGGTVTFSGDPNTDDTKGTILVCQPPQRLAFTWGEDELHFELEPVGSGHCRLTLTNVLHEGNTAARNAAGWTVCLSELDKHLAGQHSDGPHSADAAPFQPYYEAYLAAGMPSGAVIPSMPNR